MYGIQNKITITQVSTSQYPNRTKKFVFSFLISGEGAGSWDHLADTFTISMPRKVYFIDAAGNKLTWDKEAVYGNPDQQPLILRGDSVTVEWGYSFFANSGGDTFDRNTIVTKSAKRFDGYVTRIKNKSPFEIECRDNMYKLQQSLVENKEWVVDGKTYTLEKMLKEMMAKGEQSKGFTIKTDNIQTKIGKVSWSNFTIAQVLDDLRKTWKIVSFFRGNELRVGILRYYLEDRIDHTFHFQKNITEDNLDYQRADDVRIGIVAKSINKVEVGTNSSGGKKTKHQQLTTTVGDKDGELRTIFFWGIETTAELKKVAERALPYIKYEGFRGHFTTFGLPYVKHGDSVTLIDDVVPERNGTYLVKMVEQMTSSDIGITQRVHLDIRIDTLTTEQISHLQDAGI